MKPTGGTTSPPPEATADGAGGGSPDPRLSTGGGGADSGQIVQSQLTPDDHAGFRRNVTEESHAWGMTAALAPLRYPVVVGVIAFGLFNPDPAYAPNFDTQTENRPSALEAVGDTTFAVAVGALGIKLGQLGTAPQGVSAYEVDTYEALRSRSTVGDALDLHHVGQAHAMEQVVPGYNRATGPAIALPPAEHAAVPTLRGPVSMSPRDLLARDIRNLRAFTSTPNSALLQLIQLNKTMYPKAFVP